MTKKVLKRKKPVRTTKRAPRRAARPYLTRYKSEKAYYSLGVFALMLGLLLMVNQGFREKDFAMSTDRVIETKESRMLAKRPNPFASIPQVQPNGKVLTESTQVAAASPLQPPRTPQTSQLSQTSKSVAQAPVVFSGPLASEFAAVQGVGFSEKMDYWSKYLEENPYGRKKVQALSEGHQIVDFLPIFAGKYNSRSYVESVAALAMSDSPRTVVKNILSLRYKKGKGDFAHRNHLVETDWIPNNEKAGLVADITHQLATGSGLKAQIERKEIHRKKWLYAQMKRHALTRKIASVLDSDAPPAVHVSVPFIAMSELEKVLPKIPTGTIVNLVHKNDEGYPVIIGHQGILIRQGNQVLLRHANSKGIIRTNELLPYLEQLMKNQKSSRWPLIGVNFNQISSSASDSKRLSESK
jgi:hypothetical protein